jgi:hypothetical protein
MTTNIKRDFRIAFAIAALVLGYGFCGDAEAQTVQPVYTRPSKGAVLTLINASQGTALVTSPVYDWTAFTAVTATVKFSKADGTACDCPTGPGTCTFAWTYRVSGSTSKTGPFFILSSLGLGLPLQNVAIEDGFTLSPDNISTPYAQFSAQAVSYKDNTNTNVPTACFLNITITPIPFTYRTVSEGPQSAGTPLAANSSSVISGGLDYVETSTGSRLYTVRTNRVNTTGVLAVGGGSGDPLLPATSPVAVNAATLVYTATENQRGVRLQNVGANPALCAAGENAASVAAGRYSFALAAAATVGAGGTFTVEQLDTSNSAANGKVYCLGSGGATSIAIMPY